MIVFFSNICILLLAIIIIIIIIISLLLYLFFPLILISLHNVLTSFVNEPTVNARHKALIMLTGIYSLMEMQFKGLI